MSESTNNLFVIELGTFAVYSATLAILVLGPWALAAVLGLPAKV